MKPHAYGLLAVPDVALISQHGASERVRNGKGTATQHGYTAQIHGSITNRTAHEYCLWKARDGPKKQRIGHNLDATDAAAR